MSLTRSRWVLPVLSACTAAAMFASPIAWADDDKGRGGGDRGRGDEEGRRVTFVAPAPATTVVQRRGDDDENEDRAVVSTAAPLVAAINNEVANLMNGEVNVQEEDEDEVEVENEDVEVEDVDFDKVALISLGTLESRLSAADASAVTTAVTNNRTALLNFLNNGTALATAIRTALTTAGINADLSNLQAVLLGRGHRLIVVTS